MAEAASQSVPRAVASVTHTARRLIETRSLPLAVLIRRNFVRITAIHRKHRAAHSDSAGLQHRGLSGRQAPREEIALICKSQISNLKSNLSSPFPPRR